MKLHSLGKNWICALVFFFCVSGGGPVAALEEGASPSLFAAAGLTGIEFESYAGWESRYAAEGRDDLPESGVYVSGVSVGYRGFSAAFDFIGGDRTGYGEMNYGIGYGGEYQGVEFGVGYTRLEFNDVSGESVPGDNEWSAEASYGGFGFVSPSFGFVYADNRERSGSFAELKLAAALPVRGDAVSVSPYLSQSFDFGYRTKENDGLNNFQIGVEVGLEVKEGVSLSGHLSHSFKQKDVKEELKADGEVKAAGTWGGVSLSFSF